MNDILKELNSVFQIVSSIPVTGDSVDSMAIARAKLRKIYAELAKDSSQENLVHETLKE